MRPHITRVTRGPRVAPAPPDLLPWVTVHFPGPPVERVRTGSVVGDPRTAEGGHRVLGVRHLVQAALLLRAGSGNAHTLGAAIDAGHAVTMVPLMLLGGRWGRIGRRQFWLATGLAVAEIALVGTGRKR